MAYGPPPGPGGYGPPPGGGYGPPPGGGYGPPGYGPPPAGSFGAGFAPRPYAPLVQYSEKTRATALLLAWFLGWCGADRFYVGQVGLGVLKLITFGGLGLWWWIDIILHALGAVKDRDGKPLLPPQDLAGQPKVNGNHVLLASVLAGSYGIDRFMLGQTGLGVLKLCTLGGCGIWALVDVILIACGSMRDAQGNSLRWD
jgi:TM2 domain-containing membrane protein YozV